MGGATSRGVAFYLPWQSLGPPPDGTPRERPAIEVLAAGPGTVSSGVGYSYGGKATPRVPTVFGPAVGPPGAIVGMCEGGNLFSLFVLVLGL